MDIKHRLTFDDRISDEVAHAVFDQYPQLRYGLTSLMERQENWDDDIATPTSRLKILIEREERGIPDASCENDRIVDRYFNEVSSRRVDFKQHKRNEARKTASGYATFIFFVSLATTTHLVGLGSIPLGAVAAAVMYQMIYREEMNM